MTETDLPLLRASLRQDLAGLPAAHLDTIVRQIYGPAVAAEDVEGLFDDIGRGLRRAAQGVGQFARQAAPVAQRALPGLAQGAAAGSAFGPWGALIGAAAGAAGGVLSQSRNRTARGIGGAIQGAGNLVSTVRGGGATGPLGALASVGSGALGATPAGRQMRGALQAAAGPSRAPSGHAQSLAGLLARPELVQALTAAMMGGFGRPTMPVGGQQVPVSQMLSALSTVASRAAHEAAEFEPAPDRTPAFAEAAEAALGLDAEDAEGRTDALLTLLALAPSVWMQRPPPVTVQLHAADPLALAGQEWAEDGTDEALDWDWGEGEAEAEAEAWDERFDAEDLEYDEAGHG